MTAGQFRIVLERIRWTQAQLAEELRETPLRVRKMASGRAHVPTEVATWLRALAADLEAARQRNPPPVVPPARMTSRQSQPCQSERANYHPTRHPDLLGCGDHPFTHRT